MTENEMQAEMRVALMRALAACEGEIEYGPACALFAAGVKFGSEVAASACVDTVRSELQRRRFIEGRVPG